MESNHDFHSSLETESLFPRTIVDLRINETLQIGAVTNSAYQIWGQSVFLFFEFTIVIAHAYSSNAESNARADGSKS